MTNKLFARIAGTGSFLPGNPVTNADLVARGIDTSDEWITERTGIRTRHIADANVSTSDLALQAAKRALEAAGCEPNDIDLIILATTSPDHAFPSTATVLQHKLGMNNGAPAFDVQAVCGGFVYGMTIADKFIRSGSHKRVLVIGAEVFSRLVDWNDRNTCVLFGDGAGAVVLEASATPGILATAIHADGSYGDILNAPGRVCGGVVQGDPFVHMDGQAVFKFAVKVLAEQAQEVLALAGLDQSQIDWLVPHQANLRIIQSTARKLGLSVDDKVILTVSQHGNTSAASIPLALDAGVRSGKIQRGQNVLLEGVGAGFTWGGVLLTY